MKRLKTKKDNKKKINSILSRLPYKVTSKKFLGGYFIFTFDQASVCHFELKEFPDLLFGIWLDNGNEEGEGFSIFGEPVCWIDKFKPTRTDISERSVDDFIKALGTTITPEYLKEIEEHKKYLNTKEVLNRENYVFVRNKCIELSKEGDYSYYINDRNTSKWNVSPRYEIEYVIEEHIPESEDVKIEEQFEKVLEQQPHLNNSEHFLDSFFI